MADRSYDCGRRSFGGGGKMKQYHTLALKELLARGHSVLILLNPFPP